MTLTGTRVPQDVLAHIGTTLYTDFTRNWKTLRQPQTVPQALQIQTQKTQKQHNQPKQKTRPPYKTWNWKKATKQDELERK